MEPINKRALYQAYRRFILHFSLLLVMTLFGIFFYMKSSDKEYELLAKRNDEIEQLMSTRVEMNRNFQHINRRFIELGEINSGQADQLAKQRILQNEIAKSLSDVNRMIATMEQGSDRSSAVLYRKMVGDVGKMSRLQDSLYTTKNVIENRHLQLSNCLESNKKASESLRRGSLTNY